MICPVCGKKNRESTVKCAKCGLILTPGKIAARRGDVTDRLKKDDDVSHTSLSVPDMLREKRYKVIKKLGSGGMSRVFLARDSKMDCMVVVKELLPFFESETEADYLVSRFKQEAKLLYRLDHPGLPKVMDYFTENERLYFIMQYIDGKTLAAIAEEHSSGQIALKIGMDWMGKILDVLIYLHNQDPPVIHRDIKPHNIMVDTQGRIFLVDFGIAREVSGQSDTGTTVGTYGYASPENFTGKFFLSSDLFSMAATFHMLFSGSDPRERPPFNFPPMSEYRGDVPPQMDEMFSHLLQMDPEKRYQTAEQLKYDFEKVVQVLNREDGGIVSTPQKPDIEAIGGSLLTTTTPTPTPIPTIIPTITQAPSPVEVSAVDTAGAAKPLPLFKPRSRVTSKRRRRGGSGSEDENGEGYVGDEFLEDTEEGDSVAARALETLEGHMQVTPEKRKSSILKYILIFLLIGGISFFLVVFAAKKFLLSGGSVNYSVVAYSKSSSNIYKMKMAIKPLGYTFSTQEAKRFTKRMLKGYIVIQFFKNKSEAESYANLIREKGHSAEVKEDPEHGFYVQVYKVFSDKKDAEHYARRIKEVTMVKFYIEDNYIKKPQTIYMLTVSGLTDPKAASELKARFKEYTNEVEIIKTGADGKGK